MSNSEQVELIKNEHWLRGRMQAFRDWREESAFWNPYPKWSPAYEGYRNYQCEKETELLAMGEDLQWTA